MVCVCALGGVRCCVSAGRVAAPQRWAPATTLCQDPLFQLTSSIRLLPPPPCPTLQRSLHRGRRLLNRHRRRQPCHPAAAGEGGHAGEGVSSTTASPAPTPASTRCARFQAPLLLFCTWLQWLAACVSASPHAAALPCLNPLLNFAPRWRFPVQVCRVQHLYWAAPQGAHRAGPRV